MAVGEWPTGGCERIEEKDEEEKKEKTEVEPPKENTEREREREEKREQGKEERAETPCGTNWVAYEKPPPVLNQAGSSEWLVGGVKGREEDTITTAGEETLGGEQNKPDKIDKPDKWVDAEVKRESAVREKRKSGGGLRFLCFGGAKKKH
eukprot:Phypoly_transcript_12309.p3 GENE.Phypoly_transcript_12309~~Phypoly_transcript_12309.p3  ORF type:complete len:172 (-),score=43.26 Phypoly_transcript_12309:633-1082(-)